MITRVREGSESSKSSNVWRMLTTWLKYLEDCYLKEELLFFYFKSGI